jgi:tripartite-type tricarboxylate transporter receptor subunit TctC
LKRGFDGADDVDRSEAQEGHSMTLTRRRSFLGLAGASALVCVLLTSGRAQSYRSARLCLIVPYATGGPNDVIPGPPAAKLSKSWGQPFYVENLPVGAGDVNTAAAARAPADGHTAVAVASSFWINPGLYAKLGILRP